MATPSRARYLAAAVAVSQEALPTMVAAPPTGIASLGRADRALSAAVAMPLRGAAVRASSALGALPAGDSSAPPEALPGLAEVATPPRSAASWPLQWLQRPRGVSLTLLAPSAKRDELPLLREMNSL